jgi:hypothetical protein
VRVRPAHEVRPGYLELHQIETETRDLVWKVPAKGGRRLDLDEHAGKDALQHNRYVVSTRRLYFETSLASCR